MNCQCVKRVKISGKDIKRANPKCPMCRGTGLRILCSICSGAGFDGKTQAKCSRCDGRGWGIS